MRFYILALLIALAMAQEPGSDTGGPPNNGGDDRSPQDCVFHTHLPSEGIPIYHCLSTADDDASKVCMRQVSPRFQWRDGNSTGNCCPLKCLVKQLEVIDSYNNVNFRTLEAIIDRTYLTPSEKISATNLQTSCLSAAMSDGLLPKCIPNVVLHCLGKALAVNGCNSPH